MVWVWLMHSDDGLLGWGGGRDSSMKKDYTHTHTHKQNYSPSVSITFTVHIYRIAQHSTAQ